MNMTDESLITVSRKFERTIHGLNERFVYVPSVKSCTTNNLGYVQQRLLLSVNTINLRLPRC
jgi:hypothetical protein